MTWIPLLLSAGLAWSSQGPAVWSVPRLDREIVMDGFIDEWAGVPGLTLAPGGPGVDAEGTFADEDVSLLLQGLANDEYLYLALTWQDNVWDIEEVGRKDAIWVGPDKKRRDRMFLFDYVKLHVRRSNYDYTLWTSPRVDERGPFSWARLLEGYQGMERATAAPLLTGRHRADGTATMEVMLLWKELKLSPSDEKPIPLMITLTDGDHPGRLPEFKLGFLKSLVWRGELRAPRK